MHTHARLGKTETHQFARPKLTDCKMQVAALGKIAEGAGPIGIVGAVQSRYQRTLKETAFPEVGGAHTSVSEMRMNHIEARIGRQISRHAVKQVQSQSRASELRWVACRRPMRQPAQGPRLRKAAR